MQCTILYFFVIYFSILRFNVLISTALYCNVLYFTVLYCTVLYYIAFNCNILYSILCVCLSQTKETYILYRHVTIVSVLDKAIGFRSDPDRTVKGISLMHEKEDEYSKDL